MLDKVRARRNQNLSVNVFTHGGLRIANQSQEVGPPVDDYHQNMMRSTIQRKNLESMFDGNEQQDASRTLHSIQSTPINDITHTPTIPRSTQMTGFRVSERNSNVGYRNLKHSLAKVSPGGRGGPGPDLMCDTQRRQKWLFEQSQRQATGLETTEYNMTPFVNQSPTQKRLAFENTRGLPVNFDKLLPLNSISQIMDAGTASGVPPQPMKARKKYTVEK